VHPIENTVIENTVIENAVDGDAGRRALVMMTDPDLLDTVARVAAAAGCDVHRVADVGPARRHWSNAPLVLLDAAAARRCAQVGLPRRGNVVVVTTGPAPPAVWRDAVEVGVERVISPPDSESWLVTALTEASEGQHRAGMTLAIIGGRGGAGASVLAAAVAVAAARDGERVLLVDCDPLGGGLDLVLGAEETDGLRWPDIGVAGGRVPATALHAALPSPRLGRRVPGELALLSCARSTGGPSRAAVTAVIEAGRRAGEIVVCDLPRYPTDAAIAALTGADLTVLVVPADVRSCAAAARVGAVLAEHCDTVQLVVRGPAPGGVAATDVAGALELPLLAAMRPEPRLSGALERGVVPGCSRGPLAATAATVVNELRGGAATTSGRRS
jgi:secretion/DNA translocation related CpaE-like protein